MLEAYRKHVEERAELGTVPLPLNEKQVAELVELLKNPPAGEEAFLMNLLENRIPAGVDQAAYVKAAFLAAIVKGEASSPLNDKKKAVEILGTMQGGYNVQPLVAALDDETSASVRHPSHRGAVAPRAPKGAPHCYQSAHRPYIVK